MYVKDELITKLGLELVIPEDPPYSSGNGDNEDRIAKGSRNRTMVTVAARFRNGGMSGERLYEALWKENIARCQPPLTEIEIQKIAKWGNSKPVGSVPPARNQVSYKNVVEPGKIMTWKEMSMTNFPSPIYIVKELLPQGLTILAGRPKVGKSWLMQHISLAVATGGKGLNKFDVTQGDVLHMALEDTPARFQYRMFKLCGGSTIGPECAFFTDDWPRLPAASDYIERWLEKHTDCRLVVIDALARIRPRGQYRNEGVYDKDYSDIGELQKLAARYSIALVLVHHERKAESSDDYDRVSGSVGITGAADTVMILERPDRSKMQGVLIISGRDISDRKYQLVWNEHRGLWTHEGTPQEFEGRKAQADIAEAIGMIGKPCTPTEIGNATGRSKQAIYKCLQKMLESGLVEKSAAQPGKYRLVPQPTGYPENWDKM